MRIVALLVACMQEEVDSTAWEVVAEPIPGGSTLDDDTAAWDPARAGAALVSATAPSPLETWQRLARAPGWQPYAPVSRWYLDADGRDRLARFGDLQVERYPYESCALDEDTHRPGACGWSAGPFRVAWTTPGDAPRADQAPVFWYLPRPRISLDDGPWLSPAGWPDDWGRVNDADRYVDVPHLGCETLRIGSNSGGAHCCDTHWFLTDCPEGANVTRIELADNEAGATAFASDVDEDGDVEWIVRDWTFDGFIGGSDSCTRGLAYGGAATFNRILSWTLAGWRTAPRTAARAELYAHAREAAYDIVAQDPADAFGVSWAGTARALTVGSYGHLAGADNRTLVEDLTLALHDGYDARPYFESHEDFENLDPDSETDMRAMKDFLNVDCMADAPDLAAVVASSLDAYDATNIRVLWSAVPDTAGDLPGR